MDRNIIVTFTFVFASVLLGVLYVFDLIPTSKPSAPVEPATPVTVETATTTISPTVTPATKTTQSSVSTPSPLARVLSQTPPQYVIENETPETAAIEKELTEVLVSQKIEDGAWIQNLKEQNDFNPIHLRAFNSDYVLYDSGNPFNPEVVSVIFDVKAQQVKGKISETYISSTKSYALYADPQYLCIYKFGYSGCEIVPGSKLLGEEMYGEFSDFGSRLIVQENPTLREDSITIGIYAPKSVSAEGGVTMEKVRDVTYSIK